MHILMLALAAIMVASFTSPASAGVKTPLKKHEVQSQIIGHECTLFGSSTRFNFQTNGKYQFESGAKRTDLYTWSWSGDRIRGATVTYTFYKDGKHLAYNNGKLGITRIKCRR
ncbi:hypothetical protein COU14_00120 [Candidatus Kaiserbacteria bacterium CG10_big_fil_rev_8_21_14_0_10_44_10]|uniref:C-type lysozyme inhibitor domain-containing protein n=1 Tax=Candidatus Kaiserbacteria bacterium CG10_big_fil_rev_8_21_14_0_10_44_10 TaxID=1974606 RepID=A0A2H0UIL2_9BACT|nr:MAG: hypothetical protein COU14_00120 [Candidatus Kaiserbacteria bacterium CG10_big_fil_rev_8_21_14_0_10_44_10]